MPNLISADPLTIFLSILILLVVIGVVISVHEASHAFVANRLGDPTARLLGRMTLNPSVHIDPLGTILLPFILILLQLPVFGWAKPTPINPMNFAKPRRDSALVALAGPVSNVILATAFALLFRVSGQLILVDIIRLNLILAIFNLIPVPPLDGYKVVLGFLPKNLALRLSALESYGPLFILVFLLLIIQFIGPIIVSIQNVFLRLLIG